jgi:hypothetical protein
VSTPAFDHDLSTRPLLTPGVYRGHREQREKITAALSTQLVARFHQPLSWMEFMSDLRELLDVGRESDLRLDYISMGSERLEQGILDRVDRRPEGRDEPEHQLGVTQLHRATVHAPHLLRCDPTVKGGRAGKTHAIVHATPCNRVRAPAKRATPGPDRARTRKLEAGGDPRLALAGQR